ncbi:MAG: gliding motility-associated ABC transporter permease subunit GldF [Paludibacteraceae bacterium]|nr:gliding motility-associated ABC transporter permease subunit GldF [Paludibacteraceae bacterium]
MLTLLKKEFSNFFASAMGYIVIGVFLVITGLFLWVFPGEYNVMQAGYANLDGLFYFAPWLYLFLVPAVTMRLFAEEKKTGTMELLLTHPITVQNIVLSKYLAGLLLVIFSLIPTLVYFLSVWFLGDPQGNIDTGGFWGSYIGLIFLAAIYVAIGLFASSLTDNQIISFIIAAVACFFLYAGFDIMSGMASNGGTESFIASIGIDAHYKSMSRGVIDSRDVIYFLVVTASFLFLTREMLARKK